MHMRKQWYWLLSLSLAFCTTSALQAQEETPAEDPEGWEMGAGLGLDFAQLLQINPKQGAGQNRVGFGGASNFFANYHKNRFNWDNMASWQFGIQRLGAGIVAQGNETAPIPFQKAIDELRLGSKFGYQISEDSKWAYAGNFTFLSQLTPTYQGTAEYPGNFLVDVFDTGQTPLSKFFSPATITLSLGVDYAATDNLSFYYSPIGAKFITVADDSIAVLGVHGNPVERDADGNVISFENTDAQIGSLLRMDYNNTFANDKMSFTSSLLLYSNYLDSPQNVDVDWTNQLAYEIFKNFQLTLLANVFYDDNVLVQITDKNFPNGVNGLGKRVSVTQQLLLKYTAVF